jgi:hypothetical protein
LNFFSMRFSWTCVVQENRTNTGRSHLCAGVRGCHIEIHPAPPSIMRSEVGAIGYFNVSTWVICPVKRVYQAFGPLADETSDPASVVSDE